MSDNRRVGGKANDGKNGVRRNQRITSNFKGK